MCRNLSPLPTNTRPCKGQCRQSREARHLARSAGAAESWAYGRPSPVPAVGICCEPLRRLASRHGNAPRCTVLGSGGMVEKPGGMVKVCTRSTRMPVQSGPTLCPHALQIKPLRSNRSSRSAGRAPRPLGPQDGRPLASGASRGRPEPWPGWPRPRPVEPPLAW